MRLSVLLLVLMLFIVNLTGQTISDFIHVDQFGYESNTEKVAVLSNPQVGYNASDSYTAPATMELRDASTDAVVYSDAPSSWNAGATHDQSGDKGWWFDFSDYTGTGTFYVYDPVNDERSSDFEIGENVYNEVLKSAVKMFYYNRCNMAKESPYAESNWVDGNNFENALQDANCRYVYDINNAGLEKDLTGGWFDAGDYNKYITFSSSAVHQLLAAYEDNPDIFTDDWNIPESGNGIPDLLDEVKWELDWLLKMTNDDGTAIIKMGSIDYAENAAAPPSANTDQRYYGPTCTSASIAVAGMFAHAARIYDDFIGLEGFVTELETKAEATWDYVEPLIESDQLETNCDDGTIKSGDADRSVDEQKEEALAAAIYLFSHFGTSGYNDYVIAHINDAEMIQTDFWSGYDLSLQEAMLEYSIDPDGDGTTKATITNSITTAVTNNWNGFYGFNEDDLYRSYMPGWAYHWGSNLPKAGFGILNLLLNKYDINSGSADDYLKKAKEQVHYFHGVNPQGLVYLSNMYDLGADKCINEIYHTWFADGTDWDNAETSFYGPAPGFVTGGSNKDYTANTSLLPPYNQPDQKSYLDFNTNWPDNSWEITEPAIYYQAFYIRLLTNFVNSEGPLAVEWLDPLQAYFSEGNVILKWSTANEFSLDHFEVQRSSDGQNWGKIGIVSANTTTSSSSNYSFIDRDPFPGVNYYRLKEVDANRIYTFSNIASIENRVLNTFLIHPNPSNNQIIVTSNIENARIEILNTEGEILKSLLTQNPRTEINISDLSTGIYFVSILDQNGNKQVRKLVIE